ncbi:MAG: hypothetical protein OXJ52_02110 [Oligoflexia bacterium]|nr:hypothetical protein [Oligoflexia bacterium]
MSFSVEPVIPAKPVLVETRTGGGNPTEPPKLNRINIEGCSEQERNFLNGF